jgi:hypothetical protein
MWGVVMNLKQRRLTAVMVCLGLLFGGIALLRRKPASSAAPPEEVSQADPSRADRNYPSGETDSPVPAAPGQPAEPDEPIIDQVTVDKTEVCRGEENFVNVKARSRNGSQAFLTTHFVDPGTRRVLSGTRIPFRLEAPPERALEIMVEGRGGASKAAPLPHIEVKDCVAQRQLLIDVTRPPSSPDRASFVAKVMERKPEKEGAAPDVPPLEPASFEWDFGDKTTLTTSTPEAEHSYEGRDQSVAHSYFVVTVKAKDRNGNEVAGSRALWFPNEAFLPLALENRVAISVGVREANPATGAPEQIWLYHGYSSPVRIDKVIVRETVLDSSDKPERETMRRDYMPQELLGFADLPSGQSLTSRDLTALQPSAETAVRYVDVIGHTADNRKAAGTFTLLPPKKPIASD